MNTLIKPLLLTLLFLILFFSCQSVPTSWSIKPSSIRVQNLAPDLVIIEDASFKTPRIHLFFTDADLIKSALSDFALREQQYRQGYFYTQEINAYGIHGVLGLPHILNQTENNNIQKLLSSARGILVFTPKNYWNPGTMDWIFKQYDKNVKNKNTNPVEISEFNNLLIQLFSSNIDSDRANSYYIFSRNMKDFVPWIISHLNKGHSLSNIIYQVF